MRTDPGSNTDRLAGKAARVGLFVGAQLMHVAATAVLLWTFAGGVAPWPLKALVGLVVGAPWLTWLVRLPWTVRSLVQTLSRRAVPAEPVGVGAVRGVVEAADAAELDAGPERLAA